MSFPILTGRALLGIVSTIAIALSAGVAGAATFSTTDIIGTTGPLLVGTETRRVTENGQTYDETVRTYRTDTTTRTTTRTSRTVHETNTARYDYRVEARFRDTTEKWYNGTFRQDDVFSGQTRRLEWGTGSDGPSSYTFGPGARNGAQAGQRVSLGLFDHRNNMINGGIDDTNLDLRMFLTLASGRVLRFDTSFFIDHAETWDWFFTGGVADTVDISDRRRTWDFYDGDTTYSFSLLGFHQWFGGYTQYAEVAEGSGLSLNLLGLLTSKTVRTVWDTRSFESTSSSCTTETMRMPVPVPLPAGGVLLLGALGAVAALRRRNRLAA